MTKEQKLTKTGLADYKDQKIKIVGRYVKFDIWHNHSMHREYATCCLAHPENENGVLADHVWVHRADNIKERRPQLDERIRFTAIVREYRKQDGRVKDYCLDFPEDITFPDREAVALTIPDPPTEKPRDDRKPANQDSSSEPSEPALALPTGIPLAVIFKVKECAKEVGGWDSLEALVKVLRD